MTLFRRLKRDAHRGTNKTERTGNRVGRRLRRKARRVDHAAQS